MLSQKYIGKYIKFSNWIHDKIIFPAGFAGQGILIKDETVLARWS